MPAAAPEGLLLLDPGFPYGEDLLQFIWEQQLFDRHALRTTDGKAVEVIDPGRIQRDSGPDLLGAQLRIDGQRWAGTVEVHLRSSEWNAHGHQHDDAYENVVLHVVYEHDAEVSTASGRRPMTVELMPRISTQSIAAYRALMQERSAIACAKHLAAVDPVHVGAWLDRVLVERLERRTANMERAIAENGGDAVEAIYHLLAQGFGMKVNAEAFSMLAQALPLKVLLKHRDDALRVEALLFGQAGMLQVDFVDEFPRRLQEEHTVLSRLHGLRPMPVAAWKLGRMRPANLPSIRIAQFAQLIARSGDGLSGLLQCEGIGALRGMLDVTASGYWDTHHTFDREGPRRAKRLGRAVADGLIINAVVPGLFAYGRMTGRADHADKAMRLLEELPPERNAILAEWAALGLRASSAARGQALLELRRAYCSPRRCLFCGIGNQVLRSTVK